MGLFDRGFTRAGGSYAYLEVHVIAAALAPHNVTQPQLTLDRWAARPAQQLCEAWNTRLAQYRAVDPGRAPWRAWPFRLVPAVVARAHTSRILAIRADGAVLRHLVGTWT